MHIKSYKSGMLWMCVVVLTMCVSMLQAEPECRAAALPVASYKENPPIDPNSGIFCYDYFESSVFSIIYVRFKSFESDVIVQRSVLNIPFITLLATKDYPDVASSKRPSKQISTLNWPLICLSDELCFGKKSSNKTISCTTSAKQTRILDTLLFCAYENESWADKQSFTEVMRLPLTATVFQAQNTKEVQETRIVDLLIAAAYRNKLDKVTSQNHVTAADFLIIKGFEANTGKEKNSWAIGQILTPTIFSIANHSQIQSFQFTELIHIPFVGPLWASWNDGNETKNSFLPRLFKPGYLNSLKTKNGNGTIKGICNPD